MGQVTRIAEIWTSRALAPDDDLTDLAKDIEAHGLKVPVLIDHEGKVIDGLRRIKAIESLGSPVVDTVAVTLHAPAMAWIERARKHGVAAKPLTPQRIWELYRDTRPMIDVTRATLSRGTNHGAGIHVNGRANFLKAMGMTSISYFQALTQFFRMSEEDSPRGSVARELVPWVNGGEMTAYVALERIKQRTADRDVVKPAEQEHMIKTTVSTLNGIAFAVSKLGPISSEIDPRLLNESIADLSKFRRTLHQFINQLKKGQDSR